MEIELKLNEQEFEKLMQFVFLGNYVINGIRIPKDRIDDYDALMTKLLRKQYETKIRLPGADAEANELADLRDRLYDSVSGYLEVFEGDVFIEKLGERLADINYPAVESDEVSIYKHDIAAEIYVSVLKENGIKCVGVTIPSIDKEIMKELKKKTSFEKAFALRMKQLMREQNLSVEELSKRSELDEKLINAILNEEISLENVKKLCKEIMEKETEEPKSRHKE